MGEVVMNVPYLYMHVACYVLNDWLGQALIQFWMLSSNGGGSTVYCCVVHIPMWLVSHQLFPLSRIDVKVISFTGIMRSFPSTFHHRIEKYCVFSTVCSRIQ